MKAGVEAYVGADDTVDATDMWIRLDGKRWVCFETQTSHVSTFDEIFDQEFTKPHWLPLHARV